MVCVVWLLDPAKGLDAPVVTGGYAQLLHPVALVGVPDLYVSICTAEGELQRRPRVCQVLIVGTGEGESVDGR